ncbi:MAG TPA: NAD-binding protein [Pirellulaceae bacterium]|nr:NAD-binding protein [Pirellulaceae bacterium]
MLVDATIVGSSQQIADGAAVVLAGGPSDAVTTSEPLTRGFAERVFSVGPVGSGARMKLVVNLVLGLNRAVLAEGLALARAAGFDPALALDVLRQSPAASAVMTTKGPKMVSGDFTPQARLAQHAKDVDLILELGRRLDASLPLSSVHRELLGQAIAAGWGQFDNSAIAKVFERRDV